MTALTTEETKVLVLGITEAYIGEVTGNTSDLYSVGELKRIPGIKSVTVTATTTTVNSTGDEVQQGKDIIKQGYDIKFENQKIPLEAVSLINGSQLIESDSSISLLEGGSDAPKEFYFHIKSNKVNGKPGDFHCEYFVVKGLLDIGPKSGDYYTCSFAGTAYGRQKPLTVTKTIDGKPVTTTTQYPMRNFIFNATDTAVAVTAIEAGTLTFVSSIKANDVGGTIGVTLSGTTFVSKDTAELLANYTVDAGTTGLTVASVAYLNANTVLLTCTGTAKAGSISVTAKSVACANGVNSETGTYTVA